ncbi:hypothetical protein DASC09_012500 [Saccharomycopsis crataegensis]|uniref:Uncharacterized protein n=1 Tax=Saccharomycopsis crataegensis TaxID=43959 RepID=A0AAV5QG66_9ASCO|nr:hypothetical protein DASC09_012500 [Saccharomycopsis crataegensis]
MGFFTSSSKSNCNYKFANFNEKQDYLNRCQMKQQCQYSDSSGSTSGSVSKSRASSTCSSTNSNLTFQLPSRS